MPSLAQSFTKKGSKARGRNRGDVGGVLNCKVHKVQPADNAKETDDHTDGQMHATLDRFLRPGMLPELRPPIAGPSSSASTDTVASAADAPPPSREGHCAADDEPPASPTAIAASASADEAEDSDNDASSDSESSSSPSSDSDSSDSDSSDKGGVTRRMTT